MYETERIVAGVSIVWAIALLVVQFLIAWGGGRADLSVPSGNTMRGILYNFTFAMLPSHKESISKHPVEFAIGLCMHIGVFIALIKFFIALISPTISSVIPVVLPIVLGISALAGIFLLIRRIISLNLRLMSVPDDYVSIILTIGFIIFALAHETSQISSGIFLIYATALFFYLPLGKLKHVLFFFVARADYGGRLGYRGTYPSKEGMIE